MLDALIALDQEVFLWFNGFHNTFFDGLMWWISDDLIWSPFYALMLFFALRKLRSQKLTSLKYVAALVISVVITIAIADQVASGFLKPTVERLRPSHEPALEGMVHNVENPMKGGIYKGGKYGFVSSHAANTFGFAVFFLLLFKSNWGKSLLLWAAVVSYSRIYLGVHYPGDIIGGALVGLGAGVIGFWTFTKTKDYMQQKSVV